MKNEKIGIAFNSTLLYISAFLCTTILHECLHALVGALHGSDPILHHNYVEHMSSSQVPIGIQCLIALAGPIISLIQGILLGFIFLKSKERGFLQLFLLWCSILGFNNFLGYIMTGPVFTAGDIGKVYSLLEIPLLTQLIMAIFGAAFLLFIAYKMTKAFLGFSYKKTWVETARNRKSFSLHIIIIPWIFGSLVISILYLPIISIISIIYPIMSGFVFIYPWQNAARITQINVSSSLHIGKISLAGIALLVILIIIFKLVLAPGIKLY